MVGWSRGSIVNLAPRDVAIAVVCLDGDGGYGHGGTALVAKLGRLSRDGLRNKMTRELARRW